MRLKRHTRGLGAVLFGVLLLLVALACDGDNPKGAPKSEATPPVCRDYVTPDGFTCCCGELSCKRERGCSHPGGIVAAGGVAGMGSGGASTAGFGGDTGVGLFGHPGAGGGWDPCTVIKDPVGGAGGAACQAPAIDTSSDPANCGQANHACAAMTLATSQASPVAIAMDGTNIYWVNEGSSTYTGCFTDPSFPGICEPSATQNADGAVMKMPREGGTPVALASGEARPRAIAVDGTNVYWTTLGTAGSGEIKKVPIAGGALTTLASGQYLASAIAVDATSVYWTSDEAILRVPIDGGTPATLASVVDFPVALALDAGNLYWGMVGPEGGILRMPLGGGPPTPLVWFPCETSLSGIVTDSQNLYWTQSYADAVRSVPLIGGAPTTLDTNSGAGTIRITAANLYWIRGLSSTSSQPGAILMRKPLGCGAPTAIPLGDTSPTDLAVDERSIYWTSAVTDGNASRTTPLGTILGTNGTVMRLGACTNGVCE